MNANARDSLENQEWRRLCKQVLAESDPQRVSELVDQLLKELDACRDAARRRENGNGKKESPGA